MRRSGHRHHHSYSNGDKLDEYIENEILSAIISTLNSKNKQLLYLKYYENKTDYQLSLIMQNRCCITLNLL